MLVLQTFVIVYKTVNHLNNSRLLQNVHNYPYIISEQHSLQFL